MKYIWYFVFFVMSIFVFRPHAFGMFADNSIPCHVVYVAGNAVPVPPKFDPHEREAENSKNCLAHAMFFEVRKNIPKEMIMIGNVIENRIKSGLYPESVCENLTQDQFPWASYGMGNRVLNELVQSSKIDDGSWQTAQLISDKVVEGKVPDLTKGAIAFHANSMSKPKSTYWNKLKKTVKSQLHTFYAPKKI